MKGAVPLASDVESLIFEYGLRSGAVQLDSFDAERSFDEAVAQASGRRDLRELALVTIDGEDAQDFDDAVHCRKDAAGRYFLTVVVADVAELVNAGSDLDVEALKRATSVYFPDTVLPMFPPKLSNDLCSMRAGQTRLGLVCQATIASDGKLVSYEIFECLAKVARRLTYSKVDAMLANGAADREDALVCLADLGEALQKRRRRQGALALEIPSVAMQVSDGFMSGYSYEVNRLVSQKIIEECMLVANLCAADFLSRNEYPFLYRVHARPTMDQNRRLQKVLAEFGIEVKSIASVKEMQGIVDAVQQLPGLVSRVLQMNILRSLQRAEYTPNNIGHYGLACEKYTHFTSPIRRYPDLLVHRAVKDVLHGCGPKDGIHEKLEVIGRHCSIKELEADRASLDFIARQLGRTMAGHIGSVMTGLVSGMSKGGLFVHFSQGTEGMVRFADMPGDYYEVDDFATCAKGRRSGKEFCIGSELKVRVDSVDESDGRCRLSLA